MQTAMQDKRLTFRLFRIIRLSSCFGASLFGKEPRSLTSQLCDFGCSQPSFGTPLSRDVFRTQTSPNGYCTLLSTRSSIPLPARMFTLPFSTWSAISPTGSVRPAWAMVNLGNPYTPQASEENTHKACSWLSWSIAPRHFAPGVEVTCTSTPGGTDSPTM